MRKKILTLLSVLPVLVITFFVIRNPISDIPEIVNLKDLETPNDFYLIRSRIIQEVWGETNHLPARGVDQVIFGVNSPISIHKNQKSVDQWVIDLGNGFVARPYHFSPRISKNRLVIVHQGHRMVFGAGVDELVEKLVGYGFDVLLFSMPGYGSNSAPLKNGHVGIEEYGTKELNPFVYFLEPVIVSINHVKATTEISDISMVGLSGGGWTTTISGAIDSRINSIVTVAGSLPGSLRTKRDIGDWEQYGGNFYSYADYLRLYILGSIEPQRRQLQIFNAHDDCCFSADGRQEIYYQAVKDTLINMNGGSFEIMIDSNAPDHRIGLISQDNIITFLLDLTDTIYLQSR